jgi:hypothetical protein
MRLLPLLFLVLCTSAYAESNVRSGSDKLQATARINFRVIIPEVIGLNDRGVIHNGNQQIARTMTVEPGDTYFAEASTGFQKVSFGGSSLVPRTVPTLVYTIAKP